MYHRLTGLFIAKAIAKQIADKWDGYFPGEPAPALYRTPPQQGQNFPYFVLNTVQCVSIQTHNKYYTYDSVYQLVFLVHPTDTKRADILNSVALELLEMLKLLQAPYSYTEIDGNIVTDATKLVRCDNPTYKIEENAALVELRYKVNVSLEDVVLPPMNEIENNMNLKE